MLAWPHPYRNKKQPKIRTINSKLNRQWKQMKPINSAHVQNFENFQTAAHDNFLQRDYSHIWIYHHNGGKTLEWFRWDFLAAYRSSTMSLFDFCAISNCTSMQQTEKYDKLICSKGKKIHFFCLLCSVLLRFFLIAGCIRMHFDGGVVYNENGDRKGLKK